MTAARLAAARVLVSLDRGRTTLSAEVERERPELADRRDQALFLELAAGTTRWRAAVDARLAPHSRRALSDLTPEVRSVLRLAAYQLHHLDRIPAHAIVFESVELTRALRQERAAGFVNAVLRSLLRAEEQLSPLPNRPVDPADTESALAYLSITLSHPRWLVARWLARLGFDATEQWCRFNNTPPAVTVRPIRAGDSGLVLLDRLRSEGVEATPGRYVPGAVQLAPGALGGLSPVTRQALVIQDEASQLVAWLAAPPAGSSVIDLCAAPGGKTLMLAQAAGPTAVVVAADRRPARVALLRATLARAGLASSVQVLALDAEAGLPFGPVFDHVLLDAPCSGLGTIRRDPDIKWTRMEGDLPALAATQARMLEHAAAIVRPGGTMMYATCSSEPEENEAVVDRFLASTPAFGLAPIRADGVREPVAETIDDRGMLRTRPDVHGLDAFFAARLVRRKTA